MSDASALHKPPEVPPFRSYRLVAAAESVERRLSTTMLERFGLSPAEWRVLMLIGALPTAAHAIADAGSLHKTRISRAVSTLVARGLISRSINERDLREAALTATAAGADLRAAVTAAIAEFEVELTRELQPGDRVLIDRFLTGVITPSRAT